MFNKTTRWGFRPATLAILCLLALPALIAPRSAMAQEPITVEMVAVPAGSFTMGRTSAGDDALLGDDNELPRHQVTLSAYEIGKYEVTAGEYAAALNYALGQGYLFNAAGEPYDGGDVFEDEFKLLGIEDPWCPVEFSEGQFTPKQRMGSDNEVFSMDRHPIVAISWYGSAIFCNWYGEMHGLAPVYDTETWQVIDGSDARPGVQFGSGYRLPTEAEWEHAAAWDGDKHWIFGFTGDTLTGRNRANYYIGDTNEDYFSPTVTNKLVNPLGFPSFPASSPVGWFDGLNISPNGDIQTVNSVSPIGCYDMSGNVIEWSNDWFAPYTAGAQIDPMGPATGEWKTLRGGSYYYHRTFCRTAWRGINAVPDSSSLSLGFRIARSVNQNAVDAESWSRYK